MFKMEEIWKDIEGYEGLYQISNLGRVKSLPKPTNNQYNMKERILSPATNTWGYLFVYLFRKGKKKMFTIHRLVATSFIPTQNKELVVNHIDGNKTNNNVNNLEWCTYSENTQHSYALGLEKTKLGYKEARWIREHHIPYDKEYGTKALSEKFGVSCQHINTILNNKSWREIDE